MSRTLSIVRGPRALLRTQDELSPQPGRLVLDLPAQSVVPWAGMRALVALLHAQQPERVDAALDSQRVALSTVLRGLEPSLDAGEREQATRFRAQAPGYLAHNHFISWPLRQAWVSALAPLLAGRELAVVDVASLDLETLAVLSGLLARVEHLQLALGHDPAALPERALWRTELNSIHARLESMAALDFAVVRSIEGPADEAEVPPPVAPLHPCDDGLELAAMASLGEPAPDLLRLLAALEACFASFVFTPTLRLGLALLDSPVHAELEPAQLRRVHTLVALAAYNRQVRTRGESEGADEALASLLDAHLRASLEGEPSAELRAHTYYRLTINVGRRQGELGVARELADMAVNEAADAPYHQAWALNGRAYVLARSGDLDGAIADVTRALELCDAPLEGPLEAELPMTRSVLLDNLASLCAWRGDRAAALSWGRRWHENSEAMDVPNAPSDRWLALLRDSLELERATELAARGHALAEKMLVPILADYFAAQLADLHYRRGALDEARAAIQRSLEIRRRTPNPEILWATLLAAALVEWRAGALDTARSLLAELLEHPFAEHADGAAELLALRGVIEAECGAGELAEASMNEAIELAVASGVRDLLVRVACSAGEACLRLGRESQAAEAFAQALALCESDEEAEALASDRFAALVGALRCGADSSHALEAIDLLDEALLDAESWWLLEALAEALERLECQPSPQLREAMAQRAVA